MDLLIMDLRYFAFQQARQKMTEEEIEKEIEEHWNRIVDPEVARRENVCDTEGHDWHGSLCWTCFKTREVNKDGKS